MGGAWAGGGAERGDAHLMREMTLDFAKTDATPTAALINTRTTESAGAAAAEARGKEGADEDGEARGAGFAWVVREDVDCLRPHREVFLPRLLHLLLSARDARLRRGAPVKLMQRHGCETDRAPALGLSPRPLPPSPRSLPALFPALFPLDAHAEGAPRRR